MGQGDHRPQAELQLKAEPDVDHHQPHRDGQGDEAGAEQLARHLGPDHHHLLELDARDLLAQSRLDLGHRLVGVHARWRLEPQHGRIGRAEALHLGVRLAQPPERAAQLAERRRAGGDDLDLGAPGEVDAKVQVLGEEEEARGEHGDGRQRGGERRQAHEVHVGLAGQIADKGPAHGRPQIGSVLGRVARNHQPISTWVTRMAVNTEVNTPSDRVRAKPFTGPEPNWNMIRAAIRLVRLASAIDG